MTEELYKAYEADKLLVRADPVLSEQEKSEKITELSDALLQAEAELGVIWEPVFKAQLSATGGGSAAFGVPRHDETKE